MLEATLLKFVRENATTHMTGLNNKRNGAVKYEVPNKNVRDIMDGLAYTNPFIDLEEASSTGQKRKAGESGHEDEDDRGREPDHAEEPEAKQSTVGDSARRRAELLQMFESLCDRAGELSVCIMCGKESHEGTCRGIEGPNGEEDEPMSSEPQERSHHGKWRSRNEPRHKFSLLAVQ